MSQEKFMTLWLSHRNGQLYNKTGFLKRKHWEREKRKVQGIREVMEGNK